MSVERKKGNLLEQKGIIVYNGNTQGVVSGIGLQVRDRWPQSYEVYRRAWSQNELWQGHVVFVQVEKDVVLANCITREFEGIKTYVDYEALQLALYRVALYAKTYKLHVNLPMMGNKANGDIAHANWVINKELKDVPFTVWVPNGNVHRTRH